MRIKRDFHNLIDKIENEEILKGYFQLIQRLNKNQTGALWYSLSSAEQDELLLSYEESFNPANLISHEEAKKQHHRWLRK